MSFGRLSVWLGVNVWLCLGCAETQADPQAQPAECEGRATVYVPGMSTRADDAALDVELLSAEPPPPANASAVWTLRLSDRSGAPLEQASIVAIAFMPDHGHVRPTSVAEELEPGVYEVAPLALTMPGLWHVVLRIAPPGGEQTDALFAFCIVD